MDIQPLIVVRVYLYYIDCSALRVVYYRGKNEDLRIVYYEIETNLFDILC